jgi:hypothetical protein
METKNKLQPELLFPAAYLGADADILALPITRWMRIL